MLPFSQTTPLLSVLRSLSHTCSHTLTALYNMQHIINVTLSFHTKDKQSRLVKARERLSFLFLLCVFEDPAYALLSSFTFYKSLKIDIKDSSSTVR